MNFIAGLIAFCGILWNVNAVVNLPPAQAQQQILRWPLLLQEVEREHRRRGTEIHPDIKDRLYECTNETIGF